MTQPTGYWCPLCGDLPTTPNPFLWIPGKAWHHGCCAFVAIPRFKPLDVPEVTTWDSPEMVTAIDDISLVYASPDAVVSERFNFIVASRYVDPGISGMDTPTAINYVAGAK